MDHMNHNLDNNILELFEEKAADLDEYGLEPDVRPICHQFYDGFVPYTNGGWMARVMETLDGITSSGVRFNSKAQGDLDSAIEYSYRCALEAFVDENMDELEKLYGTRDTEKLYEVVNYHSLYEKDEGTLAEELSEGEHTSMSEGGEFWLELRATYFAKDNVRNETGEDEIYFHAGINTDYSYGRDKGLVLTYEFTVKASELTEAGLKTIVDLMVESLYDS